jgi:hypothetical protein
MIEQRSLAVRIRQPCGSKPEILGVRYRFAQNWLKQSDAPFKIIPRLAEFMQF